MRLAFLLAPGAALAACLEAGVANAATTEITPDDDLIAAVAALGPGDELILDGGTYNLAARFSIGVSGTEAQPIVIHGKDGETAIITRPDANQNTVNIENVQYVVLRDLEVTGGSQGIRIDSSSFVTVENCHVHDTGDVGMSANIPGADYEGLQLIHNHIHNTAGTGEGMYLGCNDNACQMHDSLIAENWIHDTKGPNVSQGDGIEVKEGSYHNVIRDNVIHDTGYPCIITYSAVGNGPPNVIERNVLWACGDHAIQSAADVVIHNNIILDANADAIRNQPHQAGDPQNIVIANNTILKPNGDAIRSDGIVGAVTISNNAVYAQNGAAIRVAGDLTSVNVVANIGIGSTVSVPPEGFSATGVLAIDFGGASFTGAPPNDVYPIVGSALIGTGDQWQLPEDDFNGTARGGQADVGAYKFDPAGNPGWTIVDGFKVLSGSIGEGGAGEGGGPLSSGGASAAGGSSSSSNSSGGSSSSGGGGASGNGDTSADDSGCSCSVPGSGSRSGYGIDPSVLFGLAAIAGLGRSRRKR